MARKRERSKKKPDNRILPLILRSEGESWQKLTETPEAAAARAVREECEAAHQKRASRKSAISQRWDATRPAEERSDGAASGAPEMAGRNSAGWPSTSNTGHPSSQNPLTLGGIDTLELGWVGNWHRAEGQKQSKKLDQFITTLETAQASLKLAGEAMGEVTGPSGETLGVRAKGFMRGPWYFPCAFDWRGMTFGVRNADCPDGFAQVFVKVSSATLMTLGPVEAKRVAVELFSKLGFTLTDEKVSRGDACIDLADQVPGEFVRRVIGKARICVPRKFAYREDEGDLSGFDTGRGDIKLRVYDKALELRDKPDAIKQSVLEKERWGKPCEVATRVEFELHREILREKWNVGGLEDFLAKLPEILRYLCEEWFRLTEDVVTDDDRENKNQSRHSVWTVWQKVTDLFQQCFAVAQQALDFDCVPADVEPTLLIKQASGCFSTAAARMRMPLKTPADLLAFFEKFVNTYGYSFLTALAKKRRAEEFTLPFAVPGIGTGPIPESRLAPF
jgi:hypothetical protein